MRILGDWMPNPIDRSLSCFESTPPPMVQRLFLIPFRALSFSVCTALEESIL
jgi:hypothetical protein